MQPSTQDTFEAWRRYVSTGALVPSLLRPQVLRAWQRAHESRVSPRLHRPERLSPNDTERFVEQHSALVAASLPYLDALSVAAGSEWHGALLGAADGRVLALRAAEQSLHGLDAVPGVGTLMAEAWAGSNGIGTVLAEGECAELVGPEHFIGGFHEHSCQGVPLRDAAGQVVGVLSLAVRADSQEGRRLRDLLLTASRGIEMELRAVSLRARLEELRYDGRAETEDLVPLHQDIVQAQAAARLQMEMGSVLLRERRPAALLAAAQESIERFVRGSRTWQLASGVALREPMSMSALVCNVAELLQTEAAIQKVRLSAVARRA